MWPRLRRKRHSLNQYSFFLRLCRTRLRDLRGLIISLGKVFLAFVGTSNSGHGLQSTKLLADHRGATWNIDGCRGLQISTKLWIRLLANGVGRYAGNGKILMMRTTIAIQSLWWNILCRRRRIRLFHNNVLTSLLHFDLIVREDRKVRARLGDGRLLPVVGILAPLGFHDIIPTVLGIHHRGGVSAGGGFRQIVIDVVPTARGNGRGNLVAVFLAISARWTRRRRSCHAVINCLRRGECVILRIRLRHEIDIESAEVGHRRVLDDGVHRDAGGIVLVCGMTRIGFGRLFFGSIIRGHGYVGRSHGGFGNDWRGDRCGDGGWCWCGGTFLGEQTNANAADATSGSHAGIGRRGWRVRLGHIRGRAVVVLLHRSRMLIHAARSAVIEATRKSNESSAVVSFGAKFSVREVRILHALGGGGRSVEVVHSAAAVFIFHSHADHHVDG
mmetsp:Transcript_20303/g.48813  ORF Transcript_20303/g.48813 Transcript_20303/m.48813 type:complete len:443 (-) Transcript_20303:160-1488(-)